MAAQTVSRSRQGSSNPSRKARGSSVISRTPVGRLPLDNYRGELGNVDFGGRTRTRRRHGNQLV